MKNKKKPEVAFNVFYFTKTGKQIDQTQIDEPDEKLAWELFEEFGHKRNKGTYMELKKTKVYE